MAQALAKLRPNLDYWAQRFERSGARGHVDGEDLLQVARLAIWQARRRFDPARGIRFSSFAGFRALGAMKDELRDTDHLSRLSRRRATAGTVHAPSLERLPVVDLVDRQGRGPAELAAASDLWAWVERVLGPRRRAVVEGYFVQGDTLLEIAFRLQLSESRVCQLLAQSLRMLRRRRRRGFGEEHGR